MANNHSIPPSLISSLIRCAKARDVILPDTLSVPLPLPGEDEDRIAARTAGIFGLRTVPFAGDFPSFLRRNPDLPFCFQATDGQWHTFEKTGRNSAGTDCIFVGPPDNEGRVAAVPEAEFALRVWGGRALQIEKAQVGHLLLRAFIIVARHYGRDYAADNLAHEYMLKDREPDHALYMRIMREKGFSAHTGKVTWEQLESLKSALPLILLAGNGAPFILHAMLPDGKAEMENPLHALAGREGLKAALPREEVEKIWGGDVIFVKPSAETVSESMDACPGEGAGSAGKQKKFGFGFFVEEIRHMKGNFAEIGLSALFLHAIGMVTPLFFQLIIDKVVTHHALTTLQVLAVGMLAAIAFEGIFSWLRSFLMLHVSTILDLRLTTRTFEHLSGIGLPFFETNPAGVLIKHMQQPEKIREFLTGRIFGTFLDSLALVVLLPVLFAYSASLTLLVLAFSGFTALIMYLAMGPFKKRLHDLYNSEGARQAFLVESIRAMPTLKSLSLEPLRRAEWNSWSALAAGMRYRVGKLGLTLNTVISTIQKIMTVAILWYGVDQVFANELTIGALIAFNMYSARVTGPLVQMVGLIQQYQETRISLEMLGRVMNEPRENGGGRGIMPPLRGHIEVQNVTFRYREDSAPALKNISFEIPAGSIVGIVGRSGSGKSTLLSLLQRLFQLKEGDIRIDGHNIRDLDMGHLRRSIGVILQNSFLFRGRVRDNIAVTRPSASAEEIMEAARTAAAHEFIEHLPEGYDTVLEEDGSNLSGGQKQRIAIARALMTDPAIMILDEATSALDPESEAQIQANMKKIGSGRTMLIVSHRLSMIRDADRILVLHNGELAGCGTHEELYAGCPRYRTLWDMQNRHMHGTPQG